MMKSANILRVNEVPEMALWRKVEAQVRVDPLVMYERVKAICFLLVSYSGSNNCPNVCMFFTKVDNP